MRRAFLSLIAVLCLAGVATAGVAEDLQAMSVTIKAKNAQGSGVLFTRGDTTFVWTAAHVVDALRTTRTIIDPLAGNSKTVVEFDDCRIVQEYQQDGRRVGERKMECRVVKFIHPKTGEDLALLQLRMRGFTKASARFYLKPEIPGIGTEVIHVGSMLGQFGSNSMTTGIISQVGRVLPKDPSAPSLTTVYDQTSAVSFPGSSGGGMFNKQGEYIGMLTQGVTSGTGFNLIVPIRRIREWTRRAKIEWAIDPGTPMPDQQTIDAMPVETE